MYRFTTELAALGPAGPEQRALFTALAGQPAEVDRFLGVLTGAVPLDGYFTPKNLLRLLGVRGMAGVMLGRLRAHTPAHTPAPEAGAVERSEPQPSNVQGGPA
jgi:hypothetical protein